MTITVKKKGQSSHGTIFNGYHSRRCFWGRSPRPDAALGLPPVPGVSPRFCHSPLPGIYRRRAGCPGHTGLVGKEFTAVTFLSLAATQFRDIREVERKTLTNLDKSNLVPRGPDYIEGIARVFEARNYPVMLIALVTSGISYLIAPGRDLAGLVMLAFSMSLMGGKVL